MFHFIRRFFVLIVLLTALGLGCKGLNKEQQAATAPVTLKYWTVFGNADELRKAAEEYRAVRPYVTVDVRRIRYEEFERLFLTALADDAGPDIVSIHTRALSRHKDRLAPMPASVRVARVEVKGQFQPQTVVTFEDRRLPSPNSIHRDYLATVADDVSRGGEVYGLPLSFDTLAVYYNKDLLDKSGVAVPPATWDEFSAAVKKAAKFDKKGNIVQAGVAMGAGNNVDNAFDILSLLMLQNGVEMVSGGQPAFAAGAESGASPSLDALRFYTEFARPTKDVYSWNETMGKAIDEFARGRAVFYLGFAFDLPRIRARGPLLNIGVIPVPQLDQNSPVNVANYYLESVVKKSRHQNEAWDFIRFLSEPARLLANSAASGQPSPLRAHVAGALEDPNLGPFVSQALNARNWYRGQDPDAAARAFQDLITGYLQPYGEQGPGERDARLLQNAAAVIGQTL